MLSALCNSYLLGKLDPTQQVTKQLASHLQNWHPNSYQPHFKVHTPIYFFHVKEHKVIYSLQTHCTGNGVFVSVSFPPS